MKVLLNTIKYTPCLSKKMYVLGQKHGDGYIYKQAPSHKQKLLLMESMPYSSMATQPIIANMYSFWTLRGHVWLVNYHQLHIFPPVYFSFLLLLAVAFFFPLFFRDFYNLPLLLEGKRERRSEIFSKESWSAFRLSTQVPSFAPLTALFSDAQEVSKHLQFAVSSVSSITIASTHFNLAPFRFAIPHNYSRPQCLRLLCLHCLFRFQPSQPNPNTNRNPGSQIDFSFLSQLYAVIQKPCACHY